MAANSLAVRAMAAATTAALLAGGGPAPAAERLPSFRADLGQTTVSGLSSGAFMAMQFHIAFSGTVRGAGVVAGGPYYCAQGQLNLALVQCMQTHLGVPDPGRLVALAQAYARQGQIDPLENLAGHRAYLFTGTNDTTVVSPVVDAARRFYLIAGLPAANLEYRNDLPAGHAMLTEDFGNPCPRTDPPYINDCDQDQAGAILRHLLPGLGPPAAPPSGSVIAFDQREFFGAAPLPSLAPVPGPPPNPLGPGPLAGPMIPPGMSFPPGAFPGMPFQPGGGAIPGMPFPPGAAPFPPGMVPGTPFLPPGAGGVPFTWGAPWPGSPWTGSPWAGWPWSPPPWGPSLPGGGTGPTTVSLNDSGYAYVPAACATGGETCRVHVVFHGCKQTVADIQEQYVRRTGYNRWAEGNRIIILYPQARSDPQGNPNGCWDWWGYSGPDYATKAGPQMAAVRAMLDRLAGERR